MSRKVSPDLEPIEISDSKTSVHGPLSLSLDEADEEKQMTKAKMNERKETGHLAREVQSKKPAGAQNEQIFSLDLIRIVLTFWIVVYHLSLKINYVADYPIGYLRFGFMGVEYFFILSGFVLTFINIDRFKPTSNNDFSIEYFKFVLNRLARLWPLHAAFTLLYFVKDWDCPTDRFIRDMTFTQIFHISNADACNKPAWFLHDELYMCLLLPFILLAINWSRYFMVAIGAILSLLFFCYLTIGRPENDFESPQIVFRTPLGFLFGVIFGCVYVLDKRRHWIFDILSLISFLFLNFHFAQFYEHGIFFYIPALIIFPIFLYFAAKSQVLHFICNNVAVKLLSEWSFGIFLAHWTLINYCEGIFKKLTPQNKKDNFMAFSYASYLLILPIGTLGFYLIEDPIRKLAKRGLKYFFE